MRRLQLKVEILLLWMLFLLSALFIPISFLLTDNGFLFSELIIRKLMSKRYEEI